MQPLELPSPSEEPTGEIVVGSTDGTGLAAIQALANDVAAGEVETIVTNCWTQPAEEVRAVYGTPAMQGAILEALRQPGQGAQAGYIWDGTYVTVTAYWEELDSPYACPMITWGDQAAGLGSFTPAMAMWRMTRILAVQDGQPVRPGDGVNYQLICDADCGDLWAPHDSAGAQGAGSGPPMASVTAAQWDRLRVLASSEITVELLSNDYYRVRSADGSTDALAYFTGGYTDFWLPYLLGEIV